MKIRIALAHGVLKEIVYVSEVVYRQDAHRSKELGAILKDEHEHHIVLCWQCHWRWIEETVVYFGSHDALRMSFESANMSKRRCSHACLTSPSRNTHRDDQPLSTCLV